MGGCVVILGPAESAAAFLSVSAVGPYGMAVN